MLLLRPAPCQQGQDLELGVGSWELGVGSWKLDSQLSALTLRAGFSSHVHCNGSPTHEDQTTKKNELYTEPSIRNFRPREPVCVHTLPSYSCVTLSYLA